MKTYVLTAITKKPYSFEKDGKKLEGYSYKAVLLEFDGDRFPLSVEVAKIASDIAESKEVLCLVGKKINANPVYDRFGRFSGFSAVQAPSDGEC